MKRAPKGISRTHCECGNDMRIVGRAPVGKSMPIYCRPCWELPAPKDLNIGLPVGLTLEEHRYVPRAGEQPIMGSNWPR